MALARNDALAPYGGGRSQQRSRGYVTVREPAKGFFVTGSSLEGMNGIYSPLRPQAQLIQQLRRKPQIAYQNDQSGWLLVLTTPPAQQAPRRRFGQPQPGRKGGQHRSLGARFRDSRWSSSEESESDDEDGVGGDGESDEPEWCLVDPSGRERFAHEGNTIIPGAGPRWRHLHRAPPSAKDPSGVTGNSEKVEAAARIELLWYECREDGYETPAEDEEELAGKFQPPPPPCRPCTDLSAVEPDDENELPWQVIAILDTSVVQDLRAAYVHYLRQINAAMGGANLPKPGAASLEGCSIPGSWTYRVIAKEGVEVRAGPTAHARWCDHRDFGQYLCGLERRGAWLRLARSGAAPGTGRPGARGRPGERTRGQDAADADELWALVEDRRGRPLLEVVPEADSANLEAPPDEGAEAEVFDRPFEPRLAGPSGADEGSAEAAAGAEEELRQGRDELQQHEAREGGRQPWRSSHEALLVVGAQVSLEGVGDPRHEGELATVVAPLGGDGQCSLRLAKDGSRLTVPAHRLRLAPGQKGDEGERAARVLGLTIADLGSASGSGPTTARERLEAARRASERDALRAASDLQLEEVRRAYARLVQDLPEAVGGGAAQTSGADPSPPHGAVEAGAVGWRAALAARAVAGGCSASDVQEGITALRHVLTDEQRRLAREAGLQWPLRSASLSSMPPESCDALRLRLTIVRGLMRGRREQEALREAIGALREHPGAPAAGLWVGRCLLRLARREEAIRSLTETVGLQTLTGADALWGHTGAAVRLRALRCADRTRGRAEDAYAHGAFDRAAELYGEALAASPSDDKWGRATLHAGRAACHRRTRALAKAVEDCDAALALFPRYARAQFRQGVCLLELGRPQEALVAFQRLLRIDRNWPKLCDWLVRAHAQAKRQDRGAGLGGARGRGGLGGDSPTGRDSADGVGTAAADVEDHLFTGDLYAVLGVSADATEKQLKQAYRVMSLKYHPDKKGGSTRAFQRIATAYQTLSDPEKRRAFDEGADLNKKKRPDDSSDSDEKEERSLFEEVERKYFPERYRFWPFGDPFIEKRKIQARRRREAGTQQAWDDS